MAITVNPPFPVFTDVDGDPLENGYLIIGLAGLDPATNPQQAYWDPGLTIPANNIRTSGGYPVRNGTPSRFYTQAEYSITVKNKNGTVVFTSLTAINYGPGDPSLQTVLTVADIRALPFVVGTTSKVQALGYYDAFDGAGGPIRVFKSGEAPGFFTDNGGSVLVPTGGDGSAAWIFSEDLPMNPRWFGAKGDGTTDDATAIQEALDVGPVHFTPGTYRVNTKLTMSNPVSADSGAVILLGANMTNMVEFNGELDVTGLTFDGGLTHTPDPVIPDADVLTGDYQTNYGFTNVIAGSVVNFTRCRWQNVYSKTFSVYGIQVRADGSIVNFSDCDFDWIISRDDVIPSEGGGSGFCGGIFVEPTGLTQVTALRLTIDNCRFSNMYTERNPGTAPGSATGYDADGIRLYLPQVNYNNAIINNVAITNCVFNRVQKRAIKNTACYGTTVDGITVKGNYNGDATRVGMGSVFSLQPVKYCNVSNVFVSSKVLYYYRGACSDVTMSNLNFDDSDGGWILYAFGLEDRQDFDESNIIIRDVRLNGCNTLVRFIQEDVAGTVYKAENVILENFDVKYIAPPQTNNVGYFAYFRNYKNLTLRNIRVRGDIDFADGGFWFQRCEDLTIDGLEASVADRFMFIEDAGVPGTLVTKNMKIINSKLTRNVEIEPTTQFILFPSTAINCEVKSTEIIAYETTVDNDFALVRSNADGFILDKVTLRMLPVAGGLFAPFGAVQLTSTNQSMRDCEYFYSGVDATPTFLVQCATGAVGCLLMGNRSNTDNIWNQEAGAGIAMNNVAPVAKNLILLVPPGAFVATGNNLQY